MSAGADAGKHLMDTRAEHKKAHWSKNTHILHILLLRFFLHKKCKMSSYFVKQALQHIPQMYEHTPTKVVLKGLQTHTYTHTHTDFQRTGQVKSIETYANRAPKTRYHI